MSATTIICPNCGGPNVEYAPEHPEGERLFCFDCSGAEGAKEIMRTMLAAARSQCDWMLEGLPREAKTDGQRALAAKHGTPYEFGQGCINALDLISPGEAKAAIDKYAREWREA